MQLARELSRPDQRLSHLDWELSEVGRAKTPPARELFDLARSLSRLARELFDLARSLSRLARALFDLARSLSRLARAETRLARDLSGLARAKSGLARDLFRLADDLFALARRMFVPARDLTRLTRRLSDRAARKIPLARGLFSLSRGSLCPNDFRCHGRPHRTTLTVAPNLFLEEEYMKSTQKQVIESYQRVQVFVNHNPLPPPATYGAAKERLDDVVARLATHSGNQAMSTRLGLAESERLRTLRRTLREQHLRPIAKIATAMLGGSPGIDKATRLPSPTIPTTKLLADAIAFRGAATPYETTFVEHGLSADFLTQLDASIEELRQAKGANDRTKQQRVAAKEGIAEELARGRQAVEMLDAIVKARFAGNREVLAVWRSAKKVLAVSGTASSNAAPQPVSVPTPAEPKAA